MSLMNKPFKLRPSGRETLWGGTRLNDDFKKNIPIENLAETWECSTHPNGPSYVDSGEFFGKTLSEVIKSHPEYLGTNPRTKSELPILIKFIDANKELSVQVHPDDGYAKEHENGALGKTEMWYVLDATKDATLVYGFVRDITKQDLVRSLNNGKIEKYMNRVHVKNGDIFFVEPGMVHAIGAGTLIAEIQQSSDLTYRLYDYNRVDKYGNKRELHIDKALDVVNLKGVSAPRQPLRVLKYKRGYASEFICRCKYFQVERVLLNTCACHELVRFSSDETSFMVLLCVGGCGTIFIGDSEVIPVFKGDCVFVPANSAEMKLHGEATFLKVVC